MPLAGYIDQELRNQIGVKLRARIKELKLSQEQAARRAGVHRTAFNRYLNGKATPRGEMLAKLCREFDLTLRLGDKDLCAEDFSTRKPRKAGVQDSHQYTLQFGQPLIFQVENGALSFEISRKPATKQVELKVRFTDSVNISA
jgi:transcriptional regulator with XRE-family HTH domain